MARAFPELKWYSWAANASVREDLVMKRACQALAAVSSLGVVIQSIAVLAQTGSPAPQERPTFRTSVEYVEVDARVVDNRNSPVRGLKKEDFRLFEDGDEQTVTTFSAIDIPVQDGSARTAMLTASGRRIEPDVSQNQVRAERIDPDWKRRGLLGSVLRELVR